MQQSIIALSRLTQTCRRFYELVRPQLYEEPFVLDEGGLYLLIAYRLIGRIAEDREGLAGLVRVYRELVSSSRLLFLLYPVFGPAVGLCAWISLT